MEIMERMKRPLTDFGWVYIIWARIFLLHTDMLSRKFEISTSYR